MRRAFATPSGVGSTWPRMLGGGCPGPLDVSHIEPHRDGGPASKDNIGMACASCNQMIESRALRVVGRAPFEKYYLRDGTFLGWGFDPERFEQEKPHVGTGRIAGDRAPPGPNGRRKKPA